jgi:uncharacterized protein YbaR (Trm112 family)
MIKIVCTSCHKPLSLDETKLPMKEVSFPCPACKTKLTVDRRTLDATPAVPAATAEGSVAGESDDEGFGAKVLIVGADNASLRKAAKSIGFAPVYFPTAQQARDYYMQEFPAVVMLNPQQLTPPPLEAMQPIISLAPGDRRKSFFILFSDNLRTFDGNAAFLYGVNLIVSTKDIGSFQQIYRDASTFHERLYNPLNTVLKAMAAS